VHMVIIRMKDGKILTPKGVGDFLLHPKEVRWLLGSVRSLPLCLSCTFGILQRKSSSLFDRPLDLNKKVHKLMEVKLHF